MILGKERKKEENYIFVFKLTHYLCTDIDFIVFYFGILHRPFCQLTIGHDTFISLFIELFFFLQTIVLLF